ncbi:MAG: bifunctional folylpolyglutamate synthase/dihydrofolate synthase [Deltaproteobacteria bacterium]|nr:bifunctional folylpolyglutamate synthase/dihydrofolate synthase [Deltaproteobacteria bacterium]
MNDSFNPDFLCGLQRSGIVPGLERIRPLLERLDNPQKKFRSVLIAGTNGKGSTAAFLESILRCCGHRTGLFTSPHLVDMRERIRIDGRPLEAERFLEYGLAVRRVLADCKGVDPTTYFETLTAIGFLAFAGEGVDVAVVEAGMGGRYDSTNAMDADISVLTNVSLDHQRFLGDRIEDIAAEKIGVARPGRAFITGVGKGLFDSVVGPGIEDIGAFSRRMGRDFKVTRIDGAIDWQGLGMSLSDARLSLRGTFQADNAALALAAAEAARDLGLKVDECGMRRGIRTTWWPGRFHVVAQNPRVIVDGCHNPGAAGRLVETLDAYPQPRPLVLVHSSRPLKDFSGVLARILPCVDHCIETTIDGLAQTRELARAARESAICDVEVIEPFAAALDRARMVAGLEGTVLISGSLHLVGEALNELRVM